MKKKECISPKQVEREIQWAIDTVFNSLNIKEITGKKCCIRETVQEQKRWLNICVRKLERNNRRDLGNMLIFLFDIT